MDEGGQKRCLETDVCSIIWRKKTGIRGWGMGERFRKWNKNVEKSWSILMLPNTFLVQNRNDKRKEEADELNGRGRQTDSFRTMERINIFVQNFNLIIPTGFSPLSWGFLHRLLCVSFLYLLLCRGNVRPAGFIRLQASHPTTTPLTNLNYCNSKATVGLSQAIRHPVWDECGSAWLSYVLAEGSGVIKLSGW